VIRKVISVYNIAMHRNIYIYIERFVMVAVHLQSY